MTTCSQHHHTLLVYLFCASMRRLLLDEVSVGAKLVNSKETFDRPTKIDLVNSGLMLYILLSILVSDECLWSKMSSQYIQIPYSSSSFYVSIAVGSMLIKMMFELLTILMERWDF